MNLEKEINLYLTRYLNGNKDKFKKFLLEVFGSNIKEILNETKVIDVESNIPDFNFYFKNFILDLDTENEFIFNLLNTISEYLRKRFDKNFIYIRIDIGETIKITINTKRSQDE